MASNIILYCFNKYRNSTKRVDASTPKVTLSGEFKSPYSWMNPVVIIDVPVGTDLVTDSINYAYLAATGKYYFIDDVVFISNSLAELHLSVDVLGSYKFAIGNSTQYVQRAASLFDGSIPDPDYGIYPMQTIYRTALDNSIIPWYSATGYSLADGCYIIGVMNSDTDALGSVSYYCLNYVAFQSLRKKLFSDASWTNMTYTQIEEPLYKSLFNPLQYITSVKWFPIFPDTTGATSITFMDLGFFPSIPVFAKTGSKAYRLASANFVKKNSGTNLVLYTHPDSGTRGDYLNCPPYLYRTLYIEPFGSIEIDTSKMGSGRPVLYWWVDFVSGEVRIRVNSSSNNNPVIAESSAMLGVDISLAQSAQGDAKSMANARSYSNIYKVTSALFNEDSAINRAVKYYGQRNIAPNITSIGSSGSLLAGSIEPYDQVSVTMVLNDDVTNHGRPLCSMKQINTLSGFIQCANAHIQAGGMLAREQALIQQMMNTGFYYE